uniref:hypothetical protein n=1 Tax=Candidatus Fimenecus sp. TaxID=3022888 RepID=UPI003FED3FDA
MAALNTIAKEWADEIRDGIAWVIVWKTGRSWNAEAFWLNCDDDTFELEDLDRARKILDQDPNAVMLNGYYCGHFGEDMSAAELAAGIRWHYENGYNLLSDSTAFPPEPMERPEGLPADLPWYGKTTSAEPDPYIYDGYMSVEDYELMHQHIVADKEREAATMELTLTIGPQEAAAIVQSLKPAIDCIVDLFNKLADWAVKALKKAAEIAARSMRKYTDALLYQANDHPKWWYLYKHAKKYRVRKKYRRRLLNQLAMKLRASPELEVIT